MIIKPLYNVLVASDLYGINMLKGKEYQVKLSRPLTKNEDRFYFIHPIYNCECIGYKRQFEIKL